MILLGLCIVSYLLHDELRRTLPSCINEGDFVEEMRSVCRYGNITEYGIYVVPVTKFFTTARKFVGRSYARIPMPSPLPSSSSSCVCVRERERWKPCLSGYSRHLTEQHKRDTEIGRHSTEICWAWADQLLTTRLSASLRSWNASSFCRRPCPATDIAWQVVEKEVGQTLASPPCLNSALTNPRWQQQQYPSTFTSPLSLSSCCCSCSSSSSFSSSFSSSSTSRRPCCYCGRRACFKAWEEHMKRRKHRKAQDDRRPAIQAGR